jgi:hypothetical protein
MTPEQAADLVNTPQPATLVRLQVVRPGCWPTLIERWCERVDDAAGQPYCYRDLLTGRNLAPRDCTEVRRGEVQVVVEEVHG